MFPKLQRILTFIRFSHTIFALPFALASMVTAARGFPGWRTFLLVLWCMVFARTAAMVFNRLVDWEFDKKNPRTEGRHRLISKSGAWALLVGSSLLFILGTREINTLCLALSPIALACIFFYSFTKRFTHYAQFFLGLALAVSPVGGWLAVTGSFAWPPLALALAVLLWVAGFDIIYATQDVDFDRQAGLHSMVVRHGISRSLQIARLLHFGMFAGLIAFGLLAQMSVVYFGSLLLIAGALYYEHRSVKSDNLATINRAFFHVNAIVGALFLCAVCLDVALFYESSLNANFEKQETEDNHRYVKF